MQIVVTQPNLVERDHAANVRAVRAMVDSIVQCAPQPEFVVLPECFFREHDYAAYQECIRAVAASTRACVIGGSVHTRVAPAAPLHNVGVVMAPDGRTLATYSKRHPYGNEVTPGVQAGQGISEFEWHGARCAVLICADVWDVRLLTQLTTPPDILFVVAATVSQEHGPIAVQHLWHALAVTRAFECTSVVAVSDWAQTPVDDHRSTCGVAGLADPSDYTGTFQPVPVESSWHCYDADLAQIHQFREARQSRNFYFW